MWGIICKEILIYILIAYFSPSFFISHFGTELVKNIVFHSSTRTIKANTTGAWYRLGHAKCIFILWGIFNMASVDSNPSTMSKLIVESTLQ